MNYKLRIKDENGHYIAHHSITDTEVVLRSTTNKVILVEKNFDPRDGRKYWTEIAELKEIK